MTKKHSKTTLISIFTTITILAWIGMEAYAQIAKTEVQTISDKVILPLDPSLDTKTLGEIEQKRFFSPVLGKTTAQESSQSAKTR